MNNLFHDLPEALDVESVDLLAKNQIVRIERIISTGHTTPIGKWYDQDEHEWVIVLRGAARLRFAEDSTPIEMNAGDHILIEAHRRHRVQWTAESEPTVWLAVFFKDS